MSPAVTGQLVDFPTRNIPKFPGIFHLLQESDNVTDFLNDRGSKARSIVTLDESP